ncbi:MAG: hypothetical protein IPN08_04950 [Bacteroidales bacterium]|nr:hypothetical protein [Bacteroidales bacterium]MBK9356731.1 hypothetical protein [Bacteroidales bacterium]
MILKYNEYNIRFADFNLNESQFDHPSNLHGIMHTYRVMTHVLRLGLLTGYISEARLAFFAAYIHDMSRKHDGYCTSHGTEAANHKLPLYKDLFIRNGATEPDLIIIGKACTMHSLGKELPPDDFQRIPVAILKDADALDRIRLGADDLDPSFLRFGESHNCIVFGQQLYFQSINLKSDKFENMLRLSSQILNL